MPFISATGGSGIGVVTGLTSLDNSIAIGGTAFIPDLSVNFPSMLLDNSRITSPVPITATTEGTADNVINGGGFVAVGGVPVVVSFSCPGVTPGANSILTLVFLRDSTVLGQAFATSAIGVGSGAFSVSVFDTPSAANHVYAVKAFLSTGTDQATILAGAGGAGNLLPGLLTVKNGF